MGRLIKVYPAGNPPEDYVKLVNNNLKETLQTIMTTIMI